MSQTTKHCLIMDIKDTTTELPKKLDELKLGIIHSCAKLKMSNSEQWIKQTELLINQLPDEFIFQKKHLLNTCDILKLHCRAIQIYELKDITRWLEMKLETDYIHLIENKEININTKILDLINIQKKD